MDVLSASPPRTCTGARAGVGSALHVEFEEHDVALLDDVVSALQAPHPLLLGTTEPRTLDEVVIPHRLRRRAGRGVGVQVIEFSFDG